MRQLEVRHLECFEAVARERHFGRAADSLGVGQPFVSLSVQRLEKAVGAPLLVRRPAVFLTPEGEALLAEVSTALSALRIGVRAVEAVRDGDAGDLRLGFPNWLAPTFVPAAIAGFKAAYPRIALSYVTTSTREQLDSILGGDLDLAFVREPIDDLASYETFLMGEEPFVLALSDSRDTGGRASARLRDFSTDSFLLFPREFAPGFHDLIAGLLRRSGLEPRKDVAAPDWFAILGLVRANGGVAIVPATLANLSLPGLRFLPLDDVDERSAITAVVGARRNSGSLRRLTDWLKAAARDRAAAETS